MKGNQFSIPLAVVFAALMAHHATAAQTPGSTTVTLADNVQNERDALQERLDAAAQKSTSDRGHDRISQWYNSRFSNRSFSNW